MKTDLIYDVWLQDDIVEEESGWKLIHGDVFRFPSNINLFSAIMGSGVQVNTMTAYDTHVARHVYVYQKRC